LVTSRNRRNFLHEKIIDVEGLATDKGIDVFIENASVYREHLENKKNIDLQDLLKQIVTSTGGHPLSIEILASSYEGNGTNELQEILKTLGKKRQNPYATEARQESLHNSLKYSIDKLNSTVQSLLPLLTIFHSPFPAEAVKKVFDIPDEQGDMLSDLYNKSLLMRIEEDPYGQLDDKFWLYTIIPAVRNNVKDANSNDLAKRLNDHNFISNYCKYYLSLIQLTHHAWGTDNQTNFIRRFDLMTLSEGRNDFDMAIEYADNFRSDDRQQEIGVKQDGSSVAIYLGLIYEKLGQYQKSIDYHTKSLEINKKLNHQKRMAIDYINIGTGYYGKGQYDDALSYLKKTLEIYEELNDRAGKAASYSNIGVVYDKKGQYDDALSYHKKALEIQEELNFKVGISASYCNIGLVYNNEGQYDDALSYHKKALEIDEELNDRVGMALDYVNIGTVYLNKGHYDIALINYKKALEIDEGLNNKVELIRDYTGIGNVYLKTKDIEKAKQAANNALAIANEFEKDTGTEPPLKNRIVYLLKSINEYTNK
jgi:tetratricopeptide (TPR) repeat protein